MCLITYAPEGRATLDWQTLDHSAKQNDDGYGVAWFKSETGTWCVSKSLRMSTMRKVIDRIPVEAPLIIHQRFATHGAKSLDNAHPFNVSGALLFHNGVISGTRADYRKSYKDKDGKWFYVEPECSDTMAYVEDELCPLVDAAGIDWLRHKRGEKYLEKRIGSSVLAIALPNDPIPLLVNERRGDWENGVFYSNSYSRPSKWKHWSEHSYGRPYGRGLYESGYDDVWADLNPKRNDSGKLLGYDPYATAAEDGDILTPDDDEFYDLEDDWDDYVEYESRQYEKLKARKD